MPESNSASRAKILVVDDEPNIRDLLKMRLLSLGYEVFEAGHQTYFHANSDVNGDGVIGFQEVIYILQRFSELR